ncbi:DUF3558 family protein [Saccharothrix sp. HUAS TT1]|uniref:DUF3558 family protein n=1 Tax=unclassified Saccharothrix TaxID=2593673 RepID=UPI00345BC8F6
MIKGLSIRVVLALTVLGVVATGCTTQGDPTPAPTGSTSAEETSEATTTSKPSGGGDSLADFDTCEALNSVAAQLNLTEVEADGKSCDAEFSATTSVTVKAQPSLKIADAVGKEVSSIDVGPRKGALATEPASSSSCLVAIEVTATSRVDVVGSANASLDEACDAAKAVAEAIEPKLPK